MNGIDHYLLQPPARGRFGLLTNHATLTKTGEPIALALLRHGVHVTKIFSPEHGVTAQAEDGSKQDNAIDYYTRLPVISLYGDHFKPTQEQLHDIDVLLIDVPNIGCRFYTYWWTVTHVLEAAAQHHKEVIVLDRANYSQRHRLTAEGPMLHEQHCASFLGRWSMPVTFGFTLGELAKWFIAQRKLSLSWHCVNATASAPFQLPPSPAIADAQTVELYPGTCLFEGVNVSVGRGTSFPFRVVGAPWINAVALQQAFHEWHMEGVTAVPYSFKPMWSVYAQEFCHGLYFTVVNPNIFRPVAFGCALLHSVATLYPDHLQMAAYPTQANLTGQRHLDLLLGIPDAFSYFTSQPKFNTLRQLLRAEAWATAVHDFLAQEQ